MRTENQEPRTKLRVSGPPQTPWGLPKPLLKEGLAKTRELRTFFTA